MYPKIRIGKFNTKLIIPVFTGVTIPKIIAIPPIPLLKILWGIRKRLKAIAIIIEPKITPRNLTISFPSFTKKSYYFKIIYEIESFR